ncbi:MAG TPA: hypothetical protein VF189_02075 [Patescibacteria group bacterium]
MKADHAVVEYYFQKHRLYDVRESGGTGSNEEARVRRRIRRLRDHLKEDGGEELTRILDSSIQKERAELRVIQGDFEI